MLATDFRVHKRAEEREKGVKEKELRPLLSLFHFPSPTLSFSLILLPSLSLSLLPSFFLGRNVARLSHIFFLFSRQVGVSSAERNIKN
jgi:hypothetical protein